MSFLPIVDRELRIGARRPTTYRMRWILVGLVLLIWFLLLANSHHSMSPVQRGRMLFVVVGIVAFVFSLLSGAFLTADCLSHEKREGTLGFLFLTNLRGYDVVLGKLMATSLHVFFGLLAVLPLLSLPMLIGGVSAAQFWRVTLALITTMLVSLSFGMLVSALARDTRTSLGATLLGLILVTGGPPAFWALGKSFSVNFPDNLLYLSPAYLYAQAHDTFTGAGHRLTNFHISLTVLLALVILFLSCAAGWLPRSWQEKGQRRAGEKSAGSRATWRFVPRPRYELNPCLWLFSRDRLPKRSALGVMALIFAAWFFFVPGCFSSSWRVKEPSFTVLMFMAFAMHLLLKVFMATEASRRFNEDRRSGALELLLVSPLGISQIISAQRAALWNMFLSPCVIVAAANVFLLWLVTGPNTMGMRGEPQAMMCELYIGGLLIVFCDMRALAWVGMLMGFRKRLHHWAIFAALLRVVLIPWAAVFFFGLLLASGGGATEEVFITIGLFYFIFAGLFDAALASWAHQTLLAELREGTRIQNPFALISRVSPRPAGAPVVIDPVADSGRTP